MSKLHEWEKVAPSTRRLPVPGGWIYDIGGLENTSAVFVPFPPPATRWVHD